MPDTIQRVLASMAGVALAPLIAVLALIVRIDSVGPAFFRATRVGEGGRRFTCYKLRTMYWSARDQEPGVTVAHDRRVTRVGRSLRRFRLDELPQLWNVVRGEMLLVGPRPEDPRYVNLADPLHRIVFSAKPGITGPAQLAYVEESAMLVGREPERTYRDDILPRKLELDAAYLRSRSSALDLWILLQTVNATMGRPPSRAAIEARL
jgi:lipopolysaccharide/colanic/teichoic acid biosynthesis glycosyltransferase